MVKNDMSFQKLVIINVGDWTMPAFEGHFFGVPDIKDGYVFRLGQYIGPYPGIYKGLIGTDLLFLGGTGGSSYSKRNSSMLIKGQQGEDVRILGSNCPPLSRWQFAYNRKRPAIENQEDWQYWPVTQALYVPGVKSTNTVASCLMGSDTGTIVSAVKSQAHFGPGVIATGPGYTRAWVLEASPSKLSSAKPHAKVSATYREKFSAGAYVRGVLNLAYPGNEAVAFTRAVLHRWTEESKTDCVIKEATRSRLLNPYGLSASATASLGDAFVTEGMRHIEKHFRAAGWSTLVISRSGHLLTEDPRGKVLKGQKVFSEALHYREISRIVSAELKLQHK